MYTARSVKCLCGTLNVISNPAQAGVESDSQSDKYCFLSFSSSYELDSTGVSVISQMAFGNDVKSPDGTNNLWCREFAPDTPTSLLATVRKLATKHSGSIIPDNTLGKCA